MQTRPSLKLGPPCITEHCQRGSMGCCNIRSGGDCKGAWQICLAKLLLYTACVCVPSAAAHLLLLGQALLPYLAHKVIHSGSILFNVHHAVCTKLSGWSTQGAHLRALTAQPCTQGLQ
jgi:hypothetical protein